MMRAGVWVIAGCLAGVLVSSPVWAEITIGVSLSTTGPGASLGIPEKNAIALLPEQIAGEKVRFIVLDDASDPSIATKNARKFVSEDKVDVLMGSAVTPASLAISEVATETRTPQISLSPFKPVNGKNEWVFFAPQHNSVMAGALVEHMKAHGVKTLGFIGFADVYGDDWLSSITPMLSAANIRLAVTERYNRTDTSVSGQILKLMAARPDAVLIVGSGSPAALPHNTLIERGYKGQIYQTHAAANQAFLTLAGKKAEGMIMPVGPVVVVDQIPDTHPSKKPGMAFVRQYEEKYGPGSFSTFAAHIHDAFRMIEMAVPVALKKGRPGTPEFRGALRDAIENNKEVIAAHGVYNMTPADHFGLDERGRVLVRVEKGAYKLISPTDHAVSGTGRSAP